MEYIIFSNLILNSIESNILYMYESQIINSKGYIYDDHLYDAMAFILKSKVNEDYLIEDLWTVIEEEYWEEQREYCREINYLPDDYEFDGNSIKDEEMLNSAAIDIALNGIYGVYNQRGFYTISWDIMNQVFPNYDEDEIKSHIQDKDYDDNVSYTELKKYIDSVISDNEVTKIAYNICLKRLENYF